MNESDYSFDSSPEEKICAQCGTTIDDIESGELLGCPECYTTFESHLKVILRRIHGGHKHEGIFPLSVYSRDSIKRLESDLKEAVAAEEFEKAARIRDLIKKIKERFDKKGQK
ncbi:MAG: UvrB/UvrC motif-containing protein [Fidelibacterota bacterium]